MVTIVKFRNLFDGFYNCGLIFKISSSMSKYAVSRKLCVNQDQKIKKNNSFVMDISIHCTQNG